MENFSTTTPISEAMIKDYFDMSDDNSQSLSTDNNLWNFTTGSSYALATSLLSNKVTITQYNSSKFFPC